MSTTIVINEVDYDQWQTDTAEFIELKNVGNAAKNLGTLTVELVNGTGVATIYQTIALPTVTLAPGDYFVICANAASTFNCDLDVTPDSNLIQNGSPDAIGLRDAGLLIDTVSYEGDTSGGYTEGSGTGVTDDASTTIPRGISRCPDGGDTDQNNLDFSNVLITPGAANPCSPPIDRATRPGDYDGDGDTDIAVFRPADGTSYLNSGGSHTQWGSSGDIPVPADYDGDGDADIAVFRPADGTWYLNSGGSHMQWGSSGDTPAPADYDGDGDVDIAVWRPNDGTWYLNSGGSHMQWGSQGDIPVPADYDGDGDTDIAVFRPADGTWYLNSGGSHTQWGSSGDIPVPADYDGDGDADIAVFRPSDGAWYLNSGGSHTQWGSSGDMPMLGDYDGDGDIDIAVWRPNDGTWYLNSGGSHTQWGSSGDIPLPPTSAALSNQAAPWIAEH